MSEVKQELSKVMSHYYTRLYISHAHKLGLPDLAKCMCRLWCSHIEEHNLNIVWVCDCGLNHDFGSKIVSLTKLDWQFIPKDKPLQDVYAKLQEIQTILNGRSVLIEKQSSPESDPKEE